MLSASYFLEVLEVCNENIVDTPVTSKENQSSNVVKVHVCTISNQRRSYYEHSKKHQRHDIDEHLDDVLV